jgi:hypothetical protein
MLAHCCGMLVVPAPKALRATYCRCNQCAVWWIDARLGTLGIYAPSDRHTSVIGINNSFLTEPFKPINDGDEFGLINKQQIDDILRACPDYYMFKTVGSNIIRFRPTFHGIAGITFTKVDSEIPPEYDKTRDY